MNSHLILFDFDGTIADSYAFVKSVIGVLAIKHKFKNLTEAEIELMRNHGAREVMKSVGIPWWKIPVIGKDVIAEFQKNITSIPLVKGIKDILIQLKDIGVDIGILTSNSPENVKLFLDNHQINTVDFIVGDVGIFGKTKSINQVVKNHQLDKQHVIYIGDEVRDVEAAKKAGIAVIAVTWGFTTRERLRQADPDFLISKPHELLLPVHQLFLL